MTRGLLWSASLFMLPVSILWWLGQLARHLSVLRGAEVMVIDSRMLNFGVSLVGMDIARRLFAGRRIVYFFSWEPTGTPNRMIGKIWPDITVIPLRRASVLFTVLGQNVRLPLPQIAVPVLEPHSGPVPVPLLPEPVPVLSPFSPPSVRSGAAAS